MTPAIERLEPCPSCGGEAWLVEFAGNKAEVRCRRWDCGHRSKRCVDATGRAQVRDAINNWNRRASPALAAGSYQRKTTQRDVDDLLSYLIEHRFNSTLGERRRETARSILADLSASEARVASLESQCFANATVECDVCCDKYVANVDGCPCCRAKKAEARVAELEDVLRDMVGIVRCDPAMDGSIRPLGLVDMRRSIPVLTKARTLLERAP